MEFTREERLAINYLLLKVMKIDGHTDISEAVVLYEISQITGITENEVDESMGMSSDEAKSIIKVMNVDKRMHVLDLFKKMASVDGHFDSKEKDLISSFFV